MVVRELIIIEGDLLGHLAGTRNPLVVVTQARMAEDDEAQLLAALGSTTASASVYESSVLRDAQLRSAPQIALPHSAIAIRIANDPLHNMSSLVPCGGEKERPTLPNLSSLTPSTSSSTTARNNIGAADVPHVLTLLSRTRDLLRSTKANGTKGIVVASNEAEQRRRRREIDILMMKEQILLGYLVNVVGLKEDDAVIPSQSRKRQRTNSIIDIADDYYGNNNVAHLDDALDETFSNATKHRSNQHRIEEKSNDDRISSTNRLDRIKNGEQLLLSETLPQKRPIRNTMMSMKSQMRVESGMKPLKSMEEERFDEDKSRLRREERRKRRVQKCRAALGMENNCSSDEECEFEAPPRKIAGILKSKNSRENDDEKKIDDPVRFFKNDIEVDTNGDSIDNNVPSMERHDEQTIMSGVRWTTSTNELDTRSKSPDLKKRSHTKVFCPVCQVILTVNLTNEDGMLPDQFLAQHIKECQEVNRTRNGGRTLRKRKKPSSIDLDDDEINDAENQMELQSDYTTANNDMLLDNNESSNGYTKPTSTAIDDIDELDYEERVDDWIEHGLDQMNDMAERDSAETPPGAIVYEGGLEIPAWVNDRLFPYQRTGVRWMWELHTQGAGGVVGDEMGLGKTVQVSSFLGAMASSRLLDSVLIVAPATMLSHWLRELKVWAPGLRRIMVHKSGERDGVSRSISKGMLRHLQKWLTNARADRVNEPIDEDDYNAYKEHAFCGTGYAIVTTYESIRRSSDDYTSHTWSYVVLDEGQKIRNPDAEVTLACKRLRTPHRLLLSGTPIQNDLRELWSLFDFIFPGRLGTLPTFEAEFADPIKRGGYSNASPMQVQLAYRCALVLRDLINPYLLRRQKKDVSEVNRMPGKTEQVLFCRLTPRQRSLYEEYLRSDEVTGVLRGSVHLLKAITVLRKICNHIDLVVGPNGSFVDENSSSDDDFYDQENIADRSGKLQVLSKILPLWHQQGHKVIIFTQWRKMLGIIEYFANTQGWKYARLDGNTNVASRQTLVDKFNTDPSYFCILMTTRTGGVGLNITGANRVLLYDPDWNPQTDAQARERAYRFGQKRDVTVYRLITAGTIEEKIYQRQIFKTALTNQILQDPKQRRLFSQKDLRDLFTLKADTNSSTETGDITKGQGVVEMNSSVEPSKSENDDEVPDNSNTLEAVIKSKGICGVFDHDFVENSSAKKKSLSVVEMEENARKEAIRKASALKHSSQSVNQDMFAPTWTGSDETKPAMASSTSLLANLYNKRMQIAASSSSSASSMSMPDFNSALLSRLRKFILRVSTTNNGLGPTTRDILAAFQDVPDSQAATFRSLLKSIAVINNGHWVFKEGQS